MTDRERASLQGILSSKNYREICPETVERVFLQKLANHRNLKEADKAARAQLHQIAGAFLTPEDLSKVLALAAEYAVGRKAALSEALCLHSSTKERTNSWRSLYERAFATIGGAPERINDMACGLNPIALGDLGVKYVRGWDIQGGAAGAVTAWGKAAGWDIRAECADLLTPRTYPEADVALLMKLLPLLERQQAGFAKRFLSECPARYAIVTFPTRTLGGRNVGMAEQYARWMAENTPDTQTELACFTEGDELVYIFERKRG